MAEQAQSYTCPNCGGPLHFDAKSGGMKCDYCDSVFTVEEAKKYYEEKIRQEESGGTAASEGAPQQEADSGGEEQEGNLRAYTCTSCGAELICDATTVASTCPYCGNPTVMAEQFGETRKPDYAVPFHFEKQEAVDRLKGYYRGKKLLPKSFADGNHIEEIQGVYVPFWLFNGSVDADMEFQCTTSSVMREGDYEVTRTRHYQVRRAGTVTFSKIPVDASSKMDDDLMDSVEPYDYSGIRPFAYEYLPGYLANRYDVEISDCEKRADERAVYSAVSEIRNTVTGYGTVQETARNTSIRRGNTEYALMPVWLLNTKWNGQNFLFAMNGQTGKMTGNLPVSPGRATAYFAGISAVAFAAVALLMALFFGGQGGNGVNPTMLIGALIFGLIVGGVTVGAMAAQMKPVAQAAGAGQYVDQSRTRMKIRTDQYTGTTETRVRVQQPQSGGGRPGGPGGPRGGGPRR